MRERLTMYCGGGILASLVAISLFGCATNQQNQNTGALSNQNANKAASANRNAETSVQPAAAPGAPLGYIDNVGGEARVGGKLIVSGWAADVEDGAPVKKVEVLIDSQVVAEATLGKDRFDVVKVHPGRKWERSGWEAIIPLNNISPGRHKITAVAYDSSGQKATLSAPRDVEITAP